jgi:hypothetical protein
MRKQLARYYQLTQEEFDDLWKNGLIVLDTNVLINFYRFSKTTNKELLDILRRYSNRIWIPYQVGWEYQKNRINVIDEQKLGYSDLITFLENNENAISKKFSKYSRHSFIEVKKIQEQIRSSFLTIKNELQNLENAHPDYSSDDPIRNELTRLYDGKTGEKYSEAQLQEIFVDGKKRYELKTPPGYKDDEKSKNNDNAQFGDLILWYQIIDKAKSSHKPIILVTDDKKEDWWYIKKGQTYGPRPELIEEIQAKANVLFYMYTSDRFLLYAKERSEQPVNQETLTEIREIRSKDEIEEVRRDEEVKIEADRDSFIIGRSVEVFGYSFSNENYVRLVLFGPGQFSEGLEIASPLVSDTNVWRHTWSPGYSIQAGLYTFVVYDTSKRISDEVSVKAEKGSVTICASGSQSYYIGEKIKISGTSTASTSVYLAIRNVSAMPHARKLDELSVISKNNDLHSFLEVAVRSDCTWSYVWDTSAIGKFLRPGIYTLYAIEGPFSLDALEEKAFGTVSIIIKKPFVSCTASQSTIAQGDRLIFTGIAEGIPRQKIQIWIFGNSFCHQEIIQTNSDSSFEYKLSPSQTKQLKPDHYYVIIQHPMMNNEFDVYVDDLKKSVLTNFPNTATPLFSIDGPGSLHGIKAAMAVVEAINNPNIDDTYTKCMFLVELPVIHIIPIGKKYAGELFTITASTNLAVDSEIMIEVNSSSYDPNQKSQPGEFSGAAGVIKVTKGELGLNHFSFDVDSSTFIPDEYIVKASALNSDVTASAIFIINKPSIILFFKNVFFSFFRK